MRRRTVTTPALLLRSVDYGDADRIVTLLTARLGKASFMARSARRSKRRFGGSLQALTLLEVEVSEGSAQLGSLVAATIARPYPRVLAELGRMSAGFAALELVRELAAEHEPDNALFTTTVTLLEALDAEAVAPEALQACFAVRVLGLVGFAPRLDQCGLCGKRPLAGQAAEFIPRQGHLVCHGCGGAGHRLTGAVRAELARASGPDWLQSARASWQLDDLRAARATIERFVEHRIGKALRSPSLARTGEG